MASFNHISGAEPSTITFKAATILQVRNSSNMHQEIISIGDPESSLGIVAVLGAAPASTTFGLVVRRVGDSTSIIKGDSTVFQGGTWVFSGNSTVIQGTSPWLIAGNSTVVQGTSPWIIGGNSTVAPLAGSTWATRPIQSSAADLQMTATPAAGSTWNVRALQSSAADLQATVTPAAGSTWAVRALQSSAADLQVTATPVAGSTWNVRALQSSAADLQVTATQAGTWTFRLNTELQSTVAPSSNSSGIIVRQVIDNILTTASTSAFAASTALSIQSSGAGLRTYVTGYSITSTVQALTKVAFYSSGNMLWPVAMAALSSAFAGVNLAVSAPAYLFKSGNQSEAMTLNTGNSTIAGFKVGVSYFRAP